MDFRRFFLDLRTLCCWPRNGSSSYPTEVGRQRRRNNSCLFRMSFINRKSSSPSRRIGFQEQCIVNVGCTLPNKKISLPKCSSTGSSVQKGLLFVVVFLRREITVKKCFFWKWRKVIKNGIIYKIIVK